jgi:hypothetical protein
MDHDSGIVRCPPGGWSGWQYPSTTLMCLSITALTAVYGGIIAVRLHGVETMRGREVISSTHNLWWTYFFVATAISHGFNAVETQVFTGGQQTEAGRIARVVSRFLLGLSCLVLTWALNHHRRHRHRNFQAEDMEPLIRRQVKALNIFSVVLYVVYVIAEVITSEIVSELDKFAEPFFWIFVSVLVLINVPNWYCAFWVALHRGEIRPNRLARGLLLGALLCRLIAIMPSNLWNGEIVPKRTVDAHPCPIGGHMSAYDIVLLTFIPIYTALFAFVLLEYRRNRLAHVLLMQSRIEEDLADGMSSASFGYGTSVNRSMHDDVGDPASYE